MIHWTENTRPDRPGIWMRKVSDDYQEPRIVKDPRDWSLGTWAFICDLPDIKDAPKYRPIRHSDAGKTIQVQWHNEWEDRYLVGIHSNGRVAYEIGGGTGYIDQSGCRILDDGTPAKKEWFVNVYEKPYCMMHATKEEADKNDSGYRVRCVRVVEVI